MKEAVKDISYYCRLFEGLRRANNNGGAPHKPIMLLSIIEAYRKGIYTDNKVYITVDLVGLFKSYWSLLVETNHVCGFALPFFHMKTAPFWSLVPNVGYEAWVNSKSSIGSFVSLNAAINHAVIDPELVDVIRDHDNRMILTQLLLDTYFPNTKAKYKESKPFVYLEDIEKQIVSETSAIYKTRIETIRQRVDDDMFQEEVFIRSNIFKREIPKIYNNTCCISGLRVDAVMNVSMIDACHIVPFSEGYNDTLTNGIALSPTLHRAFDRGIISLDDNYKVLVSKSFSEPRPSTYSIKQFEGTQILLPCSIEHCPSLEGLKYHRTKFRF